MSLKVVPSPIHGKGVFAKSPININTVLAVIKSPESINNYNCSNIDISNSDLDAVEITIEDNRVCVSKYALVDNRGVSVCQIMNDNDCILMQKTWKQLLCEIINYERRSINNNAKLYINDKDIVLVSTRNIIPDREITISYGHKYWLSELLIESNGDPLKYNLIKTAKAAYDKLYSSACKYMVKPSHLTIINELFSNLNYIMSNIEIDFNKEHIEFNMK